MFQGSNGCMEFEGFSTLTGLLVGTFTAGGLQLHLHIEIPQQLVVCNCFCLLSFPAFGEVLCTYQLDPIGLIS